MNLQYAQNAYTRARVNTSTTPLDLIIMLYDGVIEHLGKAAFFMSQRNISQKTYHISKSISIIEELLSSLNIKKGGDIALNLQSLYIYILRELTVANSSNDVDKIKHIEQLLNELRSAWRQIR